MKNKKILIIDDDLENRKVAYEALRTNLADRLESKWEICFYYLERWVDLGDTVILSDFDAIICDVFLDGRNDEKLKTWPKSTSVKDVLKMLSDQNKNTPVFVVSSQWDRGEDAIFNETIQNSNVEALLLWKSVMQEKDGKSYASAVMQKKLFPKTRLTQLEEESLITILHCSDFHYRGEVDKADLKKRLAALYSRLEKELDFDKNGSLHFLCMGGDFVDKGSLENYPELKEILKDFFDDFSKQEIPLTVLTVPGNHDYNRESAYLLIKYSYLQGSVFSPYWNFSKDISPEIYPLQETPSSMWVFEEPASLGFYFYGLNTELQDIGTCSTKEDIDEFRGFISEEELSNLRTKHKNILSKFKGKDIIPIGLMHRTISPGREVSAQGRHKDTTPSKYIRNFSEIENAVFQENASAMFLCGDIHASTSNMTTGGRSKGILSSAPPFMGAPANDLGRGFNLIQLTKQDGIITGVKIETFTYNSENEEFEKNDDRRTIFEKGKKSFNLA